MALFQDRIPVMSSLTVFYVVIILEIKRRDASKLQNKHLLAYLLTYLLHGAESFLRS